MNPLRKLLGQTAVYGLSSIVGRTLNYLLVPLYTSVMPVGDYGVISQLYAFVAFLMILLTFGMETTYFRFLQDADDKEQVYRNSFLTVVGFNVLVFLGITFFNQDIATRLLFPGHGEYITILAAIVGVDSIASLPLAKLRAQERARKFALVQFSSIAVNIILNIILLKLFYDPKLPEQGILFILIANLISSLVKPLMLYKEFYYMKWVYDKALAVKMVRYAFPIVIAGFAGIINETIDRIMLKQILSEQPNMSIAKADAEIGIYSACYKLAMLVTILLQAYRYAAEPFFFGQMKNMDRNKVYIRLMNYFVAAVCLVFLGVSLNIDIFRHFIRNQDYWVGLPVVPILLLANVFLGIYLNQSIWYKLTNQTKFGAYISIGGALLTILINYIFIPVSGFYASAWATLIVYAAQMVASYLLGQKHFPIRYNLRKFTLYLGSALIIFFIANWIDLRSGSIQQFFIHNILIGLYIMLVVYIEGIKFRRPRIQSN